MKSFIKKHFPSLFILAKKLYHNLTDYENKVRLREEQKKKLELHIMSDVFANQYIVHNGPFKGMKYIKTSSGSTLLPKVIGSYEEPIHEWIEDVVSRQYANIVNVGCAEGYYACGFAMRMPNARVIGYDIDVTARLNSKTLQNLNQLTNLTIENECTHETLNVQSQTNTLIFCDIEGYEDYLLDPLKVPNLKNVDILLEAHDCFIEGITERLIQRFNETHIIKIIVDYPFRKNFYTTPIKASKQQLEIIFNEDRSRYMNFIFLESLIK